MFHEHADDCAKRRLTGRTELRVATEFLLSQGLDGDEAAVQLSRFYYIDIDMLNEVLDAMADRPLRRDDLSRVA